MNRPSEVFFRTQHKYGAVLAYECGPSEILTVQSLKMDYPLRGSTALNLRNFEDKFTKLHSTIICTLICPVSRRECESTARRPQNKYLDRAFPTFNGGLLSRAPSNFCSGRNVSSSSIAIINFSCRSARIPRFPSRKINVVGDLTLFWFVGCSPQWP